jgi:hypothetical protein
MFLVFITQLPIYIIKFFYRLAYSVYITTIGYTLPNEKNVLDFLLNTTLVLFVQKCPGGDPTTYILHGNFNSKNPTLQAEPGIKSLQLTFQMPKGPGAVESGKILKFLIDDVETTNPQIMMAALSHYIWGIAHPKVHSVSEALIKKIEKDEIKELYPSTHATRALHWLLLKSWFSPLHPWGVFRFPISKARIIESSQNFEGFHHSGIFLFKDHPFCHFLWKARSSCFKHLGGTGLGPVYSEYFFTHTVVHSLEHYCASKFAAFRFPFRVEDEDCGWWSCFRSELVRQNFLKPTISPLWSNLMRSFPSESIYGRIYADMAVVDKELADHVTASIVS